MEGNYNTSFLLTLPENKDSEYNNKLKEYVKESFDNPWVFKVNNFSQRHKDYASVLKNNNLIDEDEMRTNKRFNPTQNEKKREIVKNERKRRT